MEKRLEMCGVHILCVMQLPRRNVRMMYHESALMKIRIKSYLSNSLFIMKN